MRDSIIFEEDPPRMTSAEGPGSTALLLQIDGYEGPIDALLDLARSQKVDLSKISILQLARQYLAFIEQAQALNLELAAEYLVMAAWLAYLKSRLLLPKAEEGAEPGAQEMAEALQFQLRRLEAMQNAAAKLTDLPQLGRDFYGRAAPEGLTVSTTMRWDCSLYDLLSTYGAIERRRHETGYDLPVFNLMSVEDAIGRLTKMLGELPRQGLRSIWTTLENFLPAGIRENLFGRSALASGLVAGLELAKQGKVEMRQDGMFKPVYMRAVLPGGEAV